VRTSADEGEDDPRGETTRVAVHTTARIGFAARGVLYGIVGLLAVQLVDGRGGASDASHQGAVDAVAARPFGGALLVVLAVGMAGYAVFRTVEAVRGEGDGGVLSRRVVPAVRALVNAGIALLAIEEVAGAQADTSESSVTAAVLGVPGGRVAVAVVGLIVVGVGGKQLAHAARGDVHELVDETALQGRRRALAHVAGRFGHLGRAVVFVLVGGFLVRAALRVDPEEGVGLDAALQELLAAPLGPWLVGVTAACLVLFGVHCLVEAAYARAAPSG
jgi:hypothetical protein